MRIFIEAVSAMLLTFLIVILMRIDNLPLNAFGGFLIGMVCGIAVVLVSRFEKELNQ